MLCQMEQERPLESILGKRRDNMDIQPNRKWEEKNKEKTRFDTARRQARRYIRQFAKEEDLQELEKIISEKRKELQK